MKQEKKTNSSTPAYTSKTQDSLENVAGQPAKDAKSSRQKRSSSKSPSSEYTDCGH